MVLLFNKICTSYGWKSCLFLQQIYAAPSLADNLHLLLLLFEFPQCTDSGLPRKLMIGILRRRNVLLWITNNDLYGMWCSVAWDTAV